MFHAVQRIFYVHLQIDLIFFLYLKRNTFSNFYSLYLEGRKKIGGGGGRRERESRGTHTHTHTVNHALCCYSFFSSQSIKEKMLLLLRCAGYLLLLLLFNGDEHHGKKKRLDFCNAKRFFLSPRKTTFNQFHVATLFL